MPCKNSELCQLLQDAGNQNIHAKPGLAQKMGVLAGSLNALILIESVLHVVKVSDGSGSIFCGSALGQVSHLWLWLELRKFPLKMSNFSIFYPLGLKKSFRVRLKSTRVKGWSASYYCGLKVSSGRVRAHPSMGVN